MDISTIVAAVAAVASAAIARAYAVEKDWSARAKVAAAAGSAAIAAFLVELAHRIGG
jgi:hypothetical protein